MIRKMLIGLAIFLGFAAIGSGTVTAGYALGVFAGGHDWFICLFMCLTGAPIIIAGSVSISIELREIVNKLT